ncbi:hypothetical protein A6B43_06805 [Vespertiliibacter pulmonis]|uniref:Uncharacterized protein DUF721 n=1 Tax=Vespertiliibacter pulmonis TaxID=1443036 RepID=A0A3N4WI91_9PAST|nr:DciA family protein [Vespertiliibacter pulmonis]QLB21246.1 hypothetical protein A6B43_06805 [Vespertiliibacter pulmonis]RPE85650.1 uncharacterized protein DUF721 [Vespertiliibacter pulmonis]
MKIQPLKNISDILQNSSLAKIVERSNQINLINQNIKQRLPTQYQNLYRIVNLYDNSLVIEVPSASVRQGFLLQQSLLLKLIQTDFPNITELEFKLNPEFKTI